MQNQMKLGQRVLFYHSNCKEPGIAGLAEISKEGYPDRKLLAMALYQQLTLSTRHGVGFRTPLLRPQIGREQPKMVYGRSEV
jgi:hypothetical protein